MNTFFDVYSQEKIIDEGGITQTNLLGGKIIRHYTAFVILARYQTWQVEHGPTIGFRRPTGPK